jgi:hypothetical protein
MIDEHGERTHCIDEPDDPDRGWRYLCELPSDAFFALANAIKAHGGFSAEDPLKNSEATQDD